MYDYYQKDYEARERIQQRRREAEAERIICRQSRARRERRRRRAQLASALDLARQAVRLRLSA